MTPPYKPPTAKVDTETALLLWNRFSTLCEDIANSEDWPSKIIASLTAFAVLRLHGTWSDVPTTPVIEYGGSFVSVRCQPVVGDISIPVEPLPDDHPPRLMATVCQDSIISDAGLIIITAKGAIYMMRS